MSTTIQPIDTTSTHILMSDFTELRYKALDKFTNDGKAYKKLHIDCRREDLHDDKPESVGFALRSGEGALWECSPESKCDYSGNCKINGIYYSVFIMKSDPDTMLFTSLDDERMVEWNYRVNA